MIFSLVAAFTAQAFVLYMLHYWSIQLSMQEPLHNPSWCSWPSLLSLLSSMMILCSCCWSILIAICQQINIQWQSSLFQSGSQYVTIRHFQMLILILYRLEWYDYMLTYSNRGNKCMRATCPINYKWWEDELSFVLQSNESAALPFRSFFTHLSCCSFENPIHQSQEIPVKIMCSSLLLKYACRYMYLICAHAWHVADSPNTNSLYQHNDSCSGVSIVELGSTLGM